MCPAILLSSFSFLASVFPARPIALRDLSERGRRRSPTHARSEHEQVQLEVRFERWCFIISNSLSTLKSVADSGIGVK
jgi:hypothetical protein